MIKGIIFDLGGTLLQFTGDIETVVRDGATAMADWYLKKKHIKLDKEALIETFIAERAAGQKIAYETQTEVLLTDSLRTALKKIEAPPSAQAFVEAAIKVYFEAEEAVWQPFPDALDALKLLKAQNYRLGLYSNAFDDPLVQRLVNRYKLRPWLSPTFSSAEWGWRKPQPEPFVLIARRWSLAPAEVVVVGDTLEADILGAQQAGMHSILVTMTEAPSNKDNRHIQPDLTAASLAELPQCLAGLD